jgi:hypothetical protein
MKPLIIFFIDLLLPDKKNFLRLSGGKEAGNKKYPLVLKVMDVFSG